ncbi:MAG: threonine ammonia-lyase [Coriobacteriia bacterium]|nr:threonine ammonia-lyase [Coriobacteriia bacterium]
MTLNLDEIKAANKRLKGIVRNTPLMYSHTLSDRVDADIYLKCENHQKTGSFKIRGAANKILKLKPKLPADTTFVTASAGNHAQGLAYAASACGYKSTVVMPKYAPIAKVEATKDYGANVKLEGDCFDDAYEYACSLPGVFVHPYEDLDVIAGQGTIGIEIMDQLPDADVVLVPAGGGGLLAGAACAIKSVNPNVEVIGVQAENANAIALSFNAKKRICTESSSTIADGIAVKNPGELNVELINKYVDDIVCVSDSDIASAVLFMLERSKLVVEPAGAVSVAALLTSQIDFSGSRVVCLLSGGNIDMNTVSNIVERGLVARYRKVEFFLRVPDRSDAVAKVLELLIESGANVLAFTIDNVSQDCEVNYQEIYVCVETCGKKHYLDLHEKLDSLGFLIKK